MLCLLTCSFSYKPPSPNGEDGVQTSNQVDNQ